MLPVILFLPVAFLKVNSLNVTLLYISTTNTDRGGFDRQYPILTAVINDIRNSLPDVFQNFQMLPLRTVFNGTFKRTFESCEFAASNVAPLFWEFYYSSEDIFRQKLSDHILLITNTDIPAPFFLMAPAIELNTRNFPTTINLFTMPDYNFYFCVESLAKNYGWKSLHVICRAQDDALFKGSCGALKDNSARGMSGSSLSLSFSNVDVQSPDFQVALREASDFRAILVLIDEWKIRQFMLEAYDMGMTNGAYVFLTYQMQGIPSLNTIRWKANDPNDTRALDAFRSLLIIADGGSADFSQLDPYWNYLQDSFLRLKNITIDREHIDVRSFLLNYELLWIFVEARRSEYVICQNLDLVITQAVLSMKDQLGNLSVIEFVHNCVNRSYELKTRNITFDTEGRAITDIAVLNVNVDTGEMKSVLVCHPVTGAIQQRNLSWFGAKQLPADFTNCDIRRPKCFHIQHPDATAALTIMPTLLATAIAIVFYRNRKSLKRKKLQHLMLEYHRFTPNAKFEAEDPDMFSSRLSFSSDLEELFCMFEDEVVLLKPVFTPMTAHNLLSNQKLCESILKIASLDIENLTKFLGITVSNRVCYFVGKIAERGRLSEFLKQSQYFQSNNLKKYLAGDLVHGVAYIHKSDLPFHGHLHVSSCWINRRFSLKIAMTGYQHLQDILRHHDSPQMQLQRQSADIFNTGKILRSIFRQDDSDELTDQPEPEWMSTISLIISSCLKKNPMERLVASQLLYLMRQIVHDNQNLIEDIVLQLTKHAQSLESMVVSRTSDLMSEMQKVDKLLLEMLPLSVIQQLRRNESVIPEMFDCATILFSDIPVFGEIVSSSSLLETITFLNRMHSSFDAAVQLFDVYKVETINDSYVVCSGLPVRNGEKHVVQICLLSLKLIDVAKTVFGPSRSADEVLVRIGINSGPVAAGVIGLRMPRYCLFGDAMNVASRMESHGQAGKIHASESTKNIACELLTSEVTFEDRGMVNIKGKGFIPTYWLNSKHS